MLATVPGTGYKNGTRGPRHTPHRPGPQEQSMVFFLAPLVVAVMIVASGTAVLVRRDRRLMAPGADAVRRARVHQRRFLRAGD
ncbi:hypothetical protein [Streptomyces sp. NPDC020996]|uniref:hypothetical protein n=1 Tax=Streptomyces sp. NPDC020996 TaxID=3154791 RepID=UPI0033EBF86C